MNLLLHSYSRTNVEKNSSLGWRSLLVKLLFLGLFAFSTMPHLAAESGTAGYDMCDDVTDGGTISGDEIGCDDPIFDPSIIISITPATGGSNALQYLWMSTTDDPNGTSSVWNIIPGSTGESYDPGPITETTYYRRCAQRVGCTLWIHESNPVVKTVQCMASCDLEIKNIIGLNPMCTPGNTGIVALSIMGGTAPITYLWSNGDTTEDITDLPGGTYCVTVTDANGCTATDCATIVAPDPINPTAQITQTTCGGSNGAIDLSVTGGTAPYIYAWNNGATTQDLSNLTAGTYCVLITDSKGCDVNVCYVVNPSSNNTVAINPSPVTICPGESVTLTASGTLSNTYLWTASAGMLSSNTGSTVTYSIAASGVYTITVQATDANGCMATTSTTVTVSSPVFVSGTPSPATCGDSNGSVTTSTTGGTAPYTYIWSNGATTANLNNLAADTYCVTVTDTNGCTDTECFNVDEIGAMPVVLASSPNNICLGESVSLTASGNSLVSYSWTATGGNLSNTTGPNNTFTATIAGTYTVTVQSTDSNGCMAMASATITVNPLPVISGTTTPATCDENNGSITASVSNSAAPITYSWNTGATTATISNLVPAQYCVTVTDANGCSDNACFTVEAIPTNPVSVSPTQSTLCPSELVTLTANGNNLISYSWTATGGNLSSTTGQSVTYSASMSGTFTITVEATDVNGCTTTANATVTVSNPVIVTGNPSPATCGDANGSVATSVTGGTLPYTYIWNNGATTANLTNLVAGQYCVTVTDANGCFSSACFFVEEIGATPVTISGPNSTCPGETITLNASGDGTSTYLWSATAGMLSSTTGQSVDYTMSMPGTYIITVQATDVNGCVATDNITVTVFTAPEIAGTATPATCGADNGSIALVVTSGAAPYSYAWSTGATTININNLAAGQYCVTVTDANGCTSSACFDVIEIVPIPVMISGPNSLCPGETIVLTASGDITSTYLWSANGGTLSSTSGQSVSLTGDTPGIIIIGIQSTDINGCVSTATTVVTVLTAPTISGTVTPATCGDSNGSIITNISTGIPPYLYSWSNGAFTANLTNIPAGQYCVTVTDANGCTGSECFDVQELGATPVTISGPTNLCPGETITLTANSDPASTYVWSASAGMLSSTTGQTVDYTMGMPGTYTITVEATNAIGCVSTASTTVTVNTPPQISGTPTPATCGNDNGAIAIVVSSGTTPFSYAWSNGAITANLSDLAAGQYCVTVTDANGCTGTECFDVEALGATPVTIAGPTTLCPGETITLTATSGPASTFVWSASAGMLSSTTGATVDYTMGMPGTYTITVEATNAVGCVSTTSTTVTVNTAPQITGTATPTTCDNDDGAITIVVTSGTTPFTYAWSNGAVTANISDLAAGQYCVTVTGTNGCTGTECFDVQGLTSTPVTISGPTALCSGETISLTANSDPASTYVWSASAGMLSSTTGQTVDYTMGMPGTYTITVEATNPAGCISTASTSVTVNAAPQITGTTTPATCDNADGAVAIVVTSGTTPYTYAWSNGAITANINNLVAGQYCVTVTDANGCTATECFDVQGLGASPVTISGPTALCPGETITLTANSDPASTYVWSASAGMLSSTTGQTVDYTMMMPGTYTITVEATNAIGCISTASTIVTVNTAPEITGTATPATCGDDNGAIAIVVTSGTMPFTYAWSNGAVTANISDLAAGQYCVTVTDANGCTGTECFDVEALGATPVTIAGPTTLCPGETITLTATSGPASTFVWSASAGMLSSTTGPTVDYTMGMPGTYTITVEATNAVGCISTTSTTVTVNTAPQITGTTTPATCDNADGSIAIVVTSGTTPYTYAWSNGAITANINNLIAGQYCVTVTDANGCTGTECFDVEGLGASPVTISGPTALCPGETITLTANSDPASTYVWSASAGMLSSTTGQTVDYTMGMPGTYTITVEATNAIGCISTASTTVTVNTPPQITGTPTPATCGNDNGAIAIVVTSGTTPYTYAWSNGAVTANISDLAAGQYCVTVTDAIGCTGTECFNVEEIAPDLVSILGPVSACVGQPLVLTGSGAIINSYSWSANAGSLSNTTGETTSFSSDTPGTFTVSVQAVDINNCPSTATTDITILATPTITGPVTDATCDEANGSIITNVSSGLAPFTYIWSNGATTANLNNIVAGQYCVTVTDANGCTGDECFDVQGLGATPVTIAGPNALCLGETITLTATSSPTSTYVWSASDGMLSSTTGPTVDYTNSLPGTYTITVEATNAIGCVSTASTTITVNTPPEITGTTTPATCDNADGSVTIVVTSGTTPYTYAWSNGAITANINNLVAGQYCVTVTDANGCTGTECFDVQGLGASPVTISGPTTLCPGETITLTATSDPASTFVWSASAGMLSSTTGQTVDYTMSMPGTYTITVEATNAIGCVSTASTTVTVNTAPEITGTTTNATCENADGSIAIVVTSGTTPYTYAWSNGAITANINNLAPGQYCVTVTDANGCTGTACFDVLGGINFTNTINSTDVTCNGGNDGTAVVSPNGGTAPYTYLWSNGATTAAISDLIAGNYCVTVTDVFGCSAVSCTDVLEPSPVTIFALATTTTCGDSNGTATVSSPEPISTILWSNGATTATINNLAAGNYTVTITNTVGCTASATVVVTPSVAITVDVSPTNTTVCPGEIVTLTGVSNQNTGVIYTYTTTGGNLNTTNMATTTFSTMTPGTYTISLQVTNTFGCTDTDQATITVLGPNSPACAPPVGTVNIGDFVFIDTNNNGIQDPNEFGVGGIDVKLMTAGPDGIFYTADDVTVDLVTTDLSGFYLFTNVAPNDYVIMFCLSLPNIDYTIQDAGGNDELDSDANPANGKTDPFTVTADQDDDLSFDAGIILIPDGCDNFTNGGEICCDQIICGAGGPVDPITNVVSPSGGSGGIEYIWMSSTIGGPFNMNTFSLIPGETGPSYDPGLVTQTVFIARCARRVGCESYRESNIIKLEVVPSAATTINSLPAFICVGETDNFNALDAGIGATYTWDLGEGANPATATGQNITGASWSTPGAKIITLTTTIGPCTATLTRMVQVGSCLNQADVNRFIALEAIHIPETTEIDLQWQTRNDMNDYVFLIEHSVDGDQYDVIYTMDGVDAYESKSYGFMDENARPGRNYYRIQHINNNGRTDRSEVKMILVDDFTYDKFIVFPNPTQDFITFESLKLSDDEGSIMISDISGKILQEIVIPANTTRHTVDISSYPPGNYVFYIRYDSFRSVPRMINKMEK